MDTPEYIQILYKYFMEDIRIWYNFEEKISRGFIYVRIKRVMYGLKQAAILAYDQLVKHLNNHGYYPVIATNAIFAYKNEKKFCLCVDDFGIKYYSTDDTDHILNSLKEKMLLPLIGKGRFFSV